MRAQVLRWWARLAAGASWLVVVSVTQAQTGPAIHFIWMGGNDCPPCVRWRRDEMPRLQAAPEFQNVRLSYVDKAIRSPVPPLDVLPAEVRPYKDQLDEASNRRVGSPQAALMVDGKVYDYFFGTRTAEHILEMVHAVRRGTTYPFARCLKVTVRGKGCEVPA